MTIYELITMAESQPKRRMKTTTTVRGSFGAQTDVRDLLELNSGGDLKIEWKERRHALHSNFLICLEGTGADVACFVRQLAWLAS